VLHEFDLEHDDDELLVVEWHMEWPGWDPWFHANPEDNTGRRWVYEINYIPYFRTDGWLPTNKYSLPVHWESEYYDNGETPVSLDINGQFDPRNRRGSFEIEVSTASELPPGDYYLHAVIVEDVTHHDGPYYSTFHKASPDYQGWPISQFPSSRFGEFDLNGDSSGNWDAMECKLICWLQDREGDKVVWQAESAYMVDFPFRTEAPDAATNFQLGSCYPNPFNPTTRVPLELEHSGSVTLEVISADGRRVALLHDGYLDAGRREFQWNGLDLGGHSAASGLYLVRARSGDMSQTQRIILAK
jgi:hypothetical protein